MNTTNGGMELAPAVNPTYEVIHLEQTQHACPMCEDYAKRQAAKPVVVMSCEGACLRGEVARQAANLLCRALAPARTARICLGGAFTKDNTRFPEYECIVNDFTYRLLLDG